jgi:hypothetical protein
MKVWQRTDDKGSPCFTIGKYFMQSTECLIVGLRGDGPFLSDFDIDRIPDFIREKIP